MVVCLVGTGEGAAFAQAGVPKAREKAAELVQSIPGGTTLGVAGLRDPASVWLEMVRGAQRTLDVQAFYITDKAGSASAPFFAAIREAASRRGVKVRVLLDAKFFKSSAETAAQLSGIAGIEIRRIRFDGVMHAKFMIADEDRAFAGSQNFDWRAISENHEIGVAIEGRVAERLQRVFNSDWQVAGEQAASKVAGVAEPVKPTGAAELDAMLVRGPVLAVSPPMAGQVAEIDALIGLIANARKSIDIQVMNYGTAGLGRGRPAWTEIKDALAAAAARGVVVRMTVADWQFRAKGALEDVKAIALLPGALVRYSVIPRAGDGCIPFARVDHAKYVLVDRETAWVGTGNWSAEYFYKSRNVAYVSREPGLAGGLGAVFDTAWTSRYLVPVSAKMALPVVPDVACEKRGSTVRAGAK